MRDLVRWRNSDLKLNATAHADARHGRLMVGIATNVLLRALVDIDHPHHASARDLLDSLTEQSPGFITQVTLVEFYWVARKSLGLDRESTLDVIAALVGTPALEFDDGEGVVRALTLAELGADFPDALIHGAMELFGVSETVTFEREAAKRLGWRYLG